MARVLLLGSGKIGRMIAKFLTATGDYRLTVGDVERSSLERMQSKVPVDVRVVDAADGASLRSAMADHDLVISALSYRFNPAVAQAAADCGLSYFDLTEDVATTRAVRTIAEHARPGQIFMPQCGLAPGFISIVAHHLAQSFDRVDRVHMRVGALPQFPTGQLKYNLTWSTDGLINEYCNPCEAIQEGQRIEVLPLEGWEQFSLDGVRYEAFNTSGGLGTLCETWDGHVRELNYKTVRYQGHCELMQFLVNELRLNQDRETLQHILERAVPVTFQDVVVTFCTAAGWRHGQLVQISDARKVYARVIDDENWSAIQITTAAGICTAIDLFTHGQIKQQGFVRQEEIDLETFLANRFGQNYVTEVTTRFAQTTTATPAR
ncbi:MAG: saccharopine dehydrogenase NADP-binding domain-containing protein [Planctomycetales bacterium]|nr:saccharopine dehydrogenase NADP-binding domain-containing protein [Planctomycetales bacterium]